MTKSEVFDKVKEIIVDQTGEDEAKVTLEANIKDDLNADSLDIFEVINWKTNSISKSKPKMESKP